MFNRLMATAILSLAMAALPAAAWAEDGNNQRAGNNMINIADEPADDEALQRESGTPRPPRSVNADGLVLLPSGATVPAPAIPDGSFTAYSGDNAGLAISSVTANISNNEFHN